MWSYTLNQHFLFSGENYRNQQLRGNSMEGGIGDVSIWREDNIKNEEGIALNQQEN